MQFDIFVFDEPRVFTQNAKQNNKYKSSFFFSHYFGRSNCIFDRQYNKWPNNNEKRSITRLGRVTVCCYSEAQQKKKEYLYGCYAYNFVSMPG